MTLEELQVVITAKTAGLQEELNNVSKRLNGLQSTTEKSMSGIKSIFNKVAPVIAGVFAVKKIIDFSKESTKAFNDISISSAKLERVMKNTMGATSGHIENIKKLINDQELEGVIGIDVQLAGAQELGTYLSEAESLKKIIPIMNDMAAQQFGLGASAESITNIATMLGKVMNGEAGGLSRYGYSFTKAQEKILKFGTEAERAAVLVQVVGESVGGMNAALVKTPAGQMKQLQFALDGVKTAIGEGIMSAVQAALPALNAMANVLLKIAQAFSAFMQSIFGKTIKMQDTQISGTQDQVSAVEDLGDAAEKAGKKAKGALAGFDEVNQLSFGGGNDSSEGLSDQANSGGGAITQLPTDPIDSNLIASVEAFKKALEPTLEALDRLKVAMKPFVDFIWQGLKDFYDYCLVPIGQWVMGDGLPRFIDALAIGFSSVSWENINESLKKLWEAITPFAINVGEGLLWFWENVLVPLGAWTVNNVVPIFLELIGSTLVILNEVLNSFKPLGEWLWVNFLQPIANWTGDVIIVSLQGLTSALQGIGNWMKEHQSVVTTITTSVVGFFTAWKVVELMAFIQMSGGVVGALTAITGAITAGITAKLADKAETIALTLMYAKDFVISVAASTAALIANTTKLVAHKVAVVASTVSQGAMTVATVAWNAVCATGTALTTAFGVAIGILTSPITLVIAAIAALVAGIILLVKNWDTVKEVGAKTWEAIKAAWDKSSIWFNTTVVDPIRKAFDTMWSNIKQFATNSWNGLKDVWNGAKTWFGITVIDPLGKAFDTMWNGIKTTCKNVFDGLVGIVKTPLNIIVDSINKVISGLNKLKIDIPDWVPGFGGETWGISIPRIPRLARGGIVDGATFMGNYVAGEAGKEMIVPLENTSFVDKLASSLGNAVMAAMQFSNRGNTDQSNTELILEIDGREFARATIPGLKKEIQRTGVKLT